MGYKNERLTCGECGRNAFHKGRCSCSTPICEYCSMFNMCKECYLHKTQSVGNYVFVAIVMVMSLLMVPVVLASPYDYVELQNVEEYTNTTFGKYHKVCTAGFCSMELKFTRQSDNDNNTINWIIVDQYGNTLYNHTNDTQAVFDKYVGGMTLYRWDTTTYGNGSASWSDWVETTPELCAQHVSNLTLGESATFLLQWHFPTDSPNKIYDLVPVHKVNDTVTNELWDYAFFTSADVPISDLVMYYPFDDDFNMPVGGGIVDNKGAGTFNMQFTSGWTPSKNYVNDTSSLLINGSRGHINMSDLDGTTMSANSSFNPRTFLRDDFTVTLYVNSSATVPLGTERILAFLTTGGLAFNRRTNGSAFIQIDFGGPSVIFDGNPNFFNGSWVHWGIVFHADQGAGGYAEFYVDGNLQLNRTHTVTNGFPPACTSFCHIGSGGGLGYTGQLDEIRFYNRSLGPDAINETRDIFLLDSPPVYNQTFNSYNTSLDNIGLQLNWTSTNDALCVTNDSDFSCIEDNASKTGNLSWAFGADAFRNVTVNVTNGDGTDTFTFLFNLTLPIVPPPTNETPGNGTTVIVNVDLSGVEDRLSLWWLLAVVALIFTLGFVSRVPLLIVLAGFGSATLAFVVYENFRSDPVFGQAMTMLLLLVSVMTWFFAWDMTRGPSDPLELK